MSGSWPTRGARDERHQRQASSMAHKRATNWASPVPQAERNCRAGGRRRYNAERRRTADARRAELLRIIVENGGLPKRCGAAIARALGTSRATICRDLDMILADLVEG